MCLNNTVLTYCVVRCCKGMQNSAYGMHALICFNIILHFQKRGNLGPWWGTFVLKIGYPQLHWMRKACYVPYQNGYVLVYSIFQKYTSS